jgi:hypothetical protein
VSDIGASIHLAAPSASHLDARIVAVQSALKDLLWKSR